jgi:hypothetical protein
MSAADPSRSSAFASLRRLTRPQPAPEEQCDLCGAGIALAHSHLLDPQTRRLVCACEPCALLFASQAVQKFRRVPAQVKVLPGFRLSDSQWDSLLIPVGMAFFYYNSALGRMAACYPSPAGATESLLPLDTWSGLVAENPALAALEPDVEALLVNRLKDAREYYLAPIDRCYELVGLLRTQWRGLAGGDEVWRALDGFFGRLRAQAGVAAPQGLERAGA